MKSLMKSAAAVSTVALLALGATSVPSLAQKTYDDGCPPGVDNCRNDDESNNRKRPRFDDDNKSGSYDGEVSDKRRAQSDWKFDSNRHERRRGKDDKFRFFFGGLLVSGALLDRSVWLCAVFPHFLRRGPVHRRPSLQPRPDHRVQRFDLYLRGT